MIRLVNMRHKWYAIEIDSIEDDLENIQALIDRGDPVALCCDLQTAWAYISEDIEMVVEP